MHASMHTYVGIDRFVLEACPFFMMGHMDRLSYQIACLYTSLCGWAYEGIVDAPVLMLESVDDRLMSSLGMGLFH